MNYSTKKELAMAYCPDIDYTAALKKLNQWIRNNTELSHVSPPRVTFPHNAVSHHSRCDFSITTSVSRFSSRRQYLKTPILHFYILHFYRDKVFCSDL